MLPVTYIVQPSDTIYSIARKFGTTANKIKEYNNLKNMEISTGQKLYVKAIFYTVQPGDSIYKVAKILNTVEKSIISLNGLTSPNLYIGQPLTIPFYTEVIVKVDNANIRSGPGGMYPVVQKMSIGSRLPVVGVRGSWYKIKLFNEKTAWIAKSVANFRTYGAKKPITSILGYYLTEEATELPSSYDSFITNKSDISEIGLFLFRISKDNPEEIEKFSDFSLEYVKNLVLVGHRNNVKMLATIHNLLYENGGTSLAKELVSKMLSSFKTREKFIENTLKLVKEYDLDGVNIDIEDVYLEDSEKLSMFYKELSSKLKYYGYYVSAALPSRISDKPFNPFSDPFDYGSIGKEVDEAVIMLYNEHGWPGSGPGPVVSIGWMEKVIGYTITKMPREKIVAAVSVFGFDFNLNTKKNKYVTYNMAMDLAKKYNKNIVFDEKTKTPTFSYVDKKGYIHEVWFENTESLKYKIDKAYEMGIKGVALWRLGMEDMGIWSMINRDVIVSRK
ncbi:glycosyl hydrolase family 18 protein [Haloimpatiens sp. FM7315]|uniref:glycosyl hydrolase family 18 protein n=1 Tax=Haloimpatiens sp. FM7315 TaxID=3298609 RepID=UPI00370BCDF4